MFYRMKIKYLILSKKFVWLFFLGLFLSGFLFYFKEKSNSLTEVKVKIIDRDKSEISKKVIREVSKLEEIHISEDADLIYEVKKGFGEKFFRRELDGLLSLKKGVSHVSVKLINDKIGSEIVRQFIYHDFFRRLNEVKEVPFEVYEKNLEKTKKLNKILYLSVISLTRESRNEMKSGNELYIYIMYFQFFIFTIIGISINSFLFLELFKEKRRGLELRLSLAGIKGSSLFLMELLHSHLSLLCFFLGFIAIYEVMSLRAFFLSFLLIELSFGIFRVMKERFLNETLFQVLSVLVTLFFLSFGMLILYFKI